MEYRYVRFGHFKIDIEKSLVERDGERVRRPDGRALIPRAVKILIRIIERRPQIVRGEDLEDLLDQRRDEAGRKEDFTKYISLLRRCMGREEFREYVNTVSKTLDHEKKGGYKFLGDVQFGPDETPKPRDAKAPKLGSRLDQRIVVAPLHELPPPHGDFTGRVKELEEVLSAEKGGVRIAGLQGPPGVGKTALALKIAEQLTPQYADAQIYFDLKGTSSRPLSATYAMRHVIWSLRPDAILPRTDMELGGLYRSLLHDKKVLLLMDNARDAAHVKLLFPPLSCFLLITSRLRFKLPGLLDKDLTTFSRSEARNLLLAITSRLEAEADTIALLCGYLPFALRAAGTVLAERVDLDPKDYVHTLKSARTRLELVDPTENIAFEASLGLSYDLLDSELQQKFRALAIFPATFDVAGAAAVWAVDSVAARETLGALVRYSMLQFNRRTGRYSLHDLVRLFADAHVRTVERTMTGRNHAKYFEKVLRTTEALYLKGRNLMKRGLSLLHAELANIQTGETWAAAHASRDVSATELCIRYPDAGLNILEFSQRPQERIRWLDAGIRAARSLNDLRAEGRHLGSLGVAYWRSGEARRAISLFRRSLTVTREVGDPRGQARALRGFGLAFHDLGQFRRAINCHKQALSLDRHVGDERDEGRNLNNLGLAYADVGKPRSAIECHKGHLVLARKIGDRRAESAALGNLAVVYRKIGNTRKAIEYHKKALGIDLKLGDRTGQAGDLWALGLAYAELGKCYRATKYYEQALVIAREIGDHLREGDVLFALSIALRKLGNRTNAISRAEEALSVYERIKQPRAAKVRQQITRWRRNGASSQTLN